MNELTIVMYHYVRPIIGSEFPGIKGLELESFKRQLDFLENNYSIVSSEQVINRILTNKPLPHNACWLTFDDGYKDHYQYVLPELLKRNLDGAFFPPRVAIQGNKVLDVNSVHHILSCANSINDLVNDLQKLAFKYGVTEKQIKEYYKKYSIANEFDQAETIFVKRMLQHVLPFEMRQEILPILFQKYVGITQEELSNKLYMSVDEIKKLISNGMYVGSHGSMHHWLNRLNFEKQKIDILSSLEFLEEVGAPTLNWIMCYPYGAYNDETISILRKYGASIGLTTDFRKSNLINDHQFKLPRFDTNHFPQ